MVKGIADQGEGHTRIENGDWGVTKHTIVQNDGIDFILILLHKFPFDFLSSLKSRPQIKILVLENCKVVNDCCPQWLIIAINNKRATF